MDVAEEALGAAVGDPHRPSDPQCEQARVDLQADVLAGAECPTDPAEHQPDRFVGQGEAGRDLAAVLVQPLGGDVQLDAVAAGIGDRQSGFEPEEGLILHADLVRRLDDHVAHDGRVTAHDPLVADEVAVRMNRRTAAVDRRFGVEQRLEDLVVDDDRRRAPAGTSRDGRRRRRRSARRRSARHRWRTPVGPD